MSTFADEFEPTQRTLQFATATGKNIFQAYRFFGIERMCWGVRYRVYCRVEREDVATLKAELSELLAEPGYVTFSPGNVGEPQHFAGTISRIRERYREDGREVIFDLSSPLELLHHEHRRGTYLEQSVLEILQSIFERHHIRYRFDHLKAEYPPLELVVQYDENTYDFVRRLMSEWGLYDFMRLEKKAHMPSAEPILIISDHAQSYTRGGETPLKGTHVVGSLRRCRKSWRYVRASERTVSPGYVMGAACGAEPGQYYRELNQGGPHSRHTFCRVDYPQGYWSRWEELSWGRIHQAHYQVTIQSAHPEFRLATVWPIHYEPEHEPIEPLVLYNVRHHIVTTLDGRLKRYRNKSQARPGEQRYYPPDIPRPAAKGPLIAHVTSEGPHVQWRNEHAQVRVHFPWDENHPPGEPSTPWLSVMQPFAGPEFGIVFTPRAGSEVIINFFHDDHARPHVQGSLPSTVQAPWQSHTISGIDTHPISPEEQPPERGNQLLFDDQAQNEHIRVHAERDLHEHVKGDYSEAIGNNRLISVGGHLYEVIREGDGELRIEQGDYDLLCQEGHIEIEAYEYCIFQTPGGSLTIDKEGIRIEGKTVTILSDDADNIDFAARQGDEHQCPELEGSEPHQGGSVTGGTPDVFVNGRPIARRGDTANCEVGGPDIIEGGAQGVFINGLSAARVGDATEHGGNITSGSSNVLIGGENTAGLSFSPAAVEQYLLSDRKKTLRLDLYYQCYTQNSEALNKVHTCLPNNLSGTLLSEQVWSEEPSVDHKLQRYHHYADGVETDEYGLKLLMSQKNSIQSIQALSWEEPSGGYYCAWAKKIRKK